MAAPTEVLPAGNEWEFSVRNHHSEYQPGRGRKAIIEPIGVLKDLVVHVQDRFIRDGWQFAAVVSDTRNLDKAGRHLIPIFTHPDYDTLLWDGDFSRFIKEGELDIDFKSQHNMPFFGSLKITDPIQEVLRGANLLAGHIMVGYNEVSSPNGILLQTGVGYFDITFRGVVEEIADRKDRIEKKMTEIKPIQREIAVLEAISVPDPKRLFQ